MNTTDERRRQLLGCGFAPPPPENLRPHVEAGAWDHPGRKRRADEKDERGRLIHPVCPGYVCGLPEVLEVSWAHAFWERGELTQFCEGASTQLLRDAIGEYAVELGAAKAWAEANPPPKAGG